MKTIYCPACGQICEVTKRNGVDILCCCPGDHKWSMMIDEEADRIMAFQCDGTSVTELPTP